MPLDQAEANRQLAAELGKIAYPAPTTPINGHLMTANGSRTAAGTEVVNSGGASYTPQNLSTALPNPSAGQATSTAAVTWQNLPNATVVGMETRDSASTPRRIRYGSIASKTVSLGDSLTIPAGQLVLSTDQA